MFSFTPLLNLLKTTYKSIILFWPRLKYAFFAQSTFLILVSLLGFLTPAIFALIINHLTVTLEPNSRFNLLVLFYLLLTPLPELLRTLQGYVNKYIYLRLEEQTEFELINMQTRLDVAQHEDPKIRDLINKVANEGIWRIKRFTDRTIYIIEDIVSLTVASIILLNAQWWTLPLLLIASIPGLIIANQYGYDVWSITSLSSEDRRRFWNLRYHFTYLPYLLELKLYQNFKHFRNLLEKLFTNFIKLQFDNEKKRVLRQLLAQIFAQLAYITVIAFFIYQVTQGELLLGTLTFLISTIYRFKNNLEGFFSSISNQYQDSLFVADFFNLKELPTQLPISTHPIKLSPNDIPVIEFKNVSFRYPDSKKGVLKDISFTLKPGEKMALVGVNGAGKTTLIKLLCRFYDPTSGEILINGHNLKDIDLHSWYHHLGILFQQYARYDLLVNNAISVGQTRKKYNKEKVIAASKHAGTHDFILDWPKKYDQQLGKEFTDGVEPSVGQWQKLALARVFYRNPSILILDEPTASLDAEAEYKIFSHLERHEKDKSSIFISHRFSTVRKADQIIVIKNGTITEKGTHQELMKQNKTYAKLFTLQAKSYTD